MKKIIALILVVMMCVTIMPAVVSANSPTLIIDGATVTPAASHVGRNNTLLVSTEILTPVFGADVAFNSDNTTATIKSAAFTVTFTIGSTTATVNGANRIMTVAPRKSGNHFLIPITYYARFIGGTTAFNASTNATAVFYFTRLVGDLKISGSTTVQPIVQKAADILVKANNRLSITVAGGGSGTGVRDAMNGTVHIGMCSREFTEAELRVLTPYAVANDGIAVIIHPDNPVNNLTTAQIRRIFAGEVTNWNQVGGANAPILVYTRESGSGTRSTFQDLIMGGSSGTPITSRATPFTSSALILQGVARQPNAIGYDSLGYVDSTVKTVSVDRIAPSAATVLDGTYKMSRQIYVCTKGEARGLAAKFIDYLRSDAIQQQAVVDEGYFQIR